MSFGRRVHSRLAVSFARCLVAVAAVLSLTWAGAFAAPAGSGTVPGFAAQLDPDTIPDLVEKVLPAVVTVYNLTTFDAGMGGDSELTPQGSGTGFVISDDGYIVTNWHVVTGGEDFAVMFTDGEVVDADLVGLDARDDLAVVKIDAGDVRSSVPLGDSDALRQGETVIAIGSPLGSFTNTVTSGIVGALGRNDFGQLASNCQNYSNLIQHDAPINPGNSGGPLFNLNGEVVGVNTLGLPMAEDGTPLQGLFFAVPSNQVKIIVEQLQQDGRISAPYIGIESVLIDPATAQQNNFDQPGAIYVERVVPDSPADEAGIQQGDILIAIDDNQITMANPLPHILLSYAPGDDVEITLVRDNRETSVDLTFDNIPDEVLAACEQPG